VELIRVSLGFPDPEDPAFVIPGTAARIQVNTVPAVPLVGLYEKQRVGANVRRCEGTG